MTDELRKAASASPTRWAGMRLVSLPSMPSFRLGGETCFGRMLEVGADEPGTGQAAERVIPQEIIL